MYQAVLSHSHVPLVPMVILQGYVEVKIAHHVLVAGTVMGLPIWNQQMCVMLGFTVKRKLIPR